MSKFVTLEIYVDIVYLIFFLDIPIQDQTS